MTHSSNVIWGLVPAAGLGARMLSAVPKQYLLVNGQTVLEATLSKLLNLNLINSIVVPISQGDKQFEKATQNIQGINAVEGGETRAHSVLNGLKYILLNGSPNDWVLVHDAARPCVQLKNIQVLINYCLNAGHGGILASPAADTLKQVSKGNKIAATLDRSIVWQAHTPQMFQVGRLMEALEYCFKKQLPVTDEASAIEFLGDDVAMIEDSRDNIKITRPEDLPLAEFILAQQNK